MIGWGAEFMVELMEASFSGARRLEDLVGGHHSLPLTLLFIYLIRYK
jgi:hypothetical protein